MQMTLEGLKALLENPKTIAAITEKTELVFGIQEHGKIRPAQEHMLSLVINQYFERNSFTKDDGKNDYEFKQINLSVHSGFVSVWMQVGRIGDEGTLASIICRDKVHCFIGVRGALKAKGKVTSKSRETTARKLHEVISLHY